MRSFLLRSLALAALTSQAFGTWSIVAVNLKTREVCSATATCVTGNDLDRSVPIVVVGKGAGASQAFVLSNAQNRKEMYTGFKQGLTTAEIMANIEAGDNTASRQFGIVSLLGDPLTFTGTNTVNFDWAGGVAGQTGDILYAIQGNSLAGASVVDIAEATLINTPGTLADKVMAAMTAAGAMGGDGRCSCLPNDPTACGTPPPAFTHSAYQAVMVLARLGDEDGGCQGSTGCVAGDYYLRLQAGGAGMDLDPVVRIQAQYDAWRAGMIGVPDGVTSDVFVDRDVLPADGRSRAKVHVRLRDIDGTPITVGGDQLRFVRLRGGTERAFPMDVIDHGDGTYEFELEATFKKGREIWGVIVERPGHRPVRIGNPAIIHTVKPDDLVVSHYEVSASEDGPVTFYLDRPQIDAHRPYWILGSNTGRQPGSVLPGGLHVPLNGGLLFDLSLLGNSSQLQGFQGSLDHRGRAEAVLDMDPTLASALVGSRLVFTNVLGWPTAEIRGHAAFWVVP